MKIGLRETTLLLSATMTVMATAIIAPSLPMMTTHFQEAAGAEMLSKLVLTMSALTVALFAPFVGMLSDKIGRKRVLMASLLLYAVSGTAGYFLTDLYSLLVSRAFLGVAIGGTMTMTGALIADYFHGEERTRFMGYQSSAVAAGGLIFLPLGGYLAELDWRNPFLVYLLSLLVLPLVARSITDAKTPPPPHKPGEEAPEGSYRPFFVGAFLAMATFYVTPVQLPYYMTHYYQSSPAHVGLAIAVITVFSSVLSFNFRKIRKKLGERNTFALALLLMGVGLAQLAFPLGAWAVMLSMPLYGVGLGMLLPNLNLAVASRAPEQTRGKVMGTLNTSMFIGMFASPLLTQPLVDRLGYAGTFGAIGVLVWVAALKVWSKGR